MEIALLAAAAAAVAVLLTVVAWLARELRQARSAGTAAVEDAVRHAVDEVRRQSVEERDQALKAAMDQLLTATKGLTEHQRQVAEQALDARQQAIDAQVTEMRHQLLGMTEMVQTLERDRRAQHGALDATLKALTTNTRSLTDALASPKARGQWGERAADDILKAAGLVEGVSYVKQKAVAGGGIPDFTFRLPDDRVLHMDVKFPVDAYLRYLEADSDTDRVRHRSDFLKAVRQRVKELAARSYAGDGHGTADQVLCFVPNESVFSFICEHDDALLDDALRQRVVLCSPTTLFAVLAVLRQAAEALHVERTSDEVLQLLGAFEQQWSKFCESITTLGRRLESASRAFDDLSGTRRRQLEKPLVDLDALRRQRGLAVAEGYGGPAGDDAPPLRAVGDERF